MKNRQNSRKQDLNSLTELQGMIEKLSPSWPRIQQLGTGADGTGPRVMSERTRSAAKDRRHIRARPICPDCGVECG